MWLFEKFNFYKNNFLDSAIYFLRLSWLLIRKFGRRLHSKIFSNKSVFRSGRVAKNPWFSSYLEVYSRYLNWVNRSTLNFAIFFFGTSALFAIVRYFQIWLTGAWNLLPLFYIVVTFSFFVSLCAVYGKHQSNASPRVFRNRIKWNQYVDGVIREKGLRRSQFFANYLWTIPIFTPINVLSYINDWYYFNKNQTLTVIGLILHVVALIYTINLIYYTINFYLYIIKSPTPDKYLPEPPEFYVKLISYPPIDRILSRKYSSKTKWERAQLLFSKHKKSIVTGTALVFTSLTFLNTTGGLDGKQAEYRGTTSFVSRAGLSSETGGYWSDDPRAHRRARAMSRWGMELDELAYEGSKRLDPAKVNAAYENEHAIRYPRSRFAAERKITVLEAELSETKTELSETKKRLERLESKLLSKSKEKSSLE